MERTSYQFKEEVSQTGVSWVATDTVQLGTIHLKTQSLVDVKVLETEIMLKSYIRAWYSHHISLLLSSCTNLWVGWSPILAKQLQCRQGSIGFDQFSSIQSHVLGQYVATLQGQTMIEMALV